MAEKTHPLWPLIEEYAEASASLASGEEWDAGRTGYQARQKVRQKRYDQAKAALDAALHSRSN